ncbi:MAG: hypothetical protein KF691_15005 [Phycisphaeraceae bacterium]|nr:hypothetical protein [Phycisphaeraceae bacterium]
MDHAVAARPSQRRTAVVATAMTIALVAGAMALRSVMLFSRVLPPGIDAAYYPMQARGVLENGKLPYVEVPFIFWLDAALAKALMILRGMDVDSATLLASRIVDAVSQPLAAIPLALLLLGLAGAIRARNAGSSGEQGESRRAVPRALVIAIAIFAVGAIAILSPPILRMTGDFQKNSLGLVWMAACACAIYAALRRGGVIRWLFVVLFLALAAITHIGAFGVTMVLVSSSIGVFVLFRAKPRPKTIVLSGLACIAGAGILWLLVYSVAPSKAIGLTQGVTKMFGAGDRPQGRPALFDQPGRPDFRSDRPHFDGPDTDQPSFDRPMQDSAGPNRPMQFDRGPGGPPGGFPAGALPMRAGAWAVLLVFGSLAIWRARHVGVAEMAIVSGAVCTALLVTCPLIQGQYAERLSLMTPIPLAIIVGFLLLSGAESIRTWVRIGAPALGAIVGIVILILAFPMALRGKGGPPPRFANNSGNFARGTGNFSGRGSPNGPQGPGVQNGGDGPGAPGGGGGGGSVVADDAVPEFRSMRGLVPSDGSAVVLARHGLQWWAGYFLKTPVREEHATEEQLEKYQQVFVLTEKRRGSEAGFDSVGELSGNRDRVPADGDQRRPPDGGTMIRVPPGAEVVYDGTFYRLSRRR